jgi:ribulose-5-phosphate 4-epimerase/fuculose-1-phosphate aldolase
MIEMTFLEAAHYIAEKNLVSASSGNMSHCRYESHGSKIWITATGAWFSNLCVDDIVECSFPDGKVLRAHSDNKPSSELKMHLDIFNVRKGINTVLHFQSPYATTLAASFTGSWLGRLSVIPEIPYYIGSIGCVDYYTPGSDALAESVAEAAAAYDVVFMKNHGQIVVGTSFMDVIQKASFVELASMILVNGKEIQTLTDQNVADLVAYRNKK